MASKAVVVSLYEALSRGDKAAAAALLAEDLEWWFHGPRRCQYMRRMLTGEDEEAAAAASAGGGSDFRFRPRRVAEVGGGWVVAEGWEGKHAYWVHAWAVEGGVITRFREYFNTAVTVQEVSPPETAAPGSVGKSPAAAAAAVAAAVWQSGAPAHIGGRSLPGLVLAI